MSITNLSLCEEHSSHSCDLLFPMESFESFSWVLTELNMSKCFDLVPAEQLKPSVHGRLGHKSTRSSCV